MVSRKIHVSWYAWASALMPQKIRKKSSEAVSEKKVKPSSDTDKDNDDRQKRKRLLSIYV